jgi:hypothetical protein
MEAGAKLNGREQSGELGPSALSPSPRQLNSVAMLVSVT